MDGSRITQIRVTRDGTPLPPRTLDFLDDALCRGVLRQAGPVYLFRHERLRRALLDQHKQKQQQRP